MFTALLVAGTIFTIIVGYIAARWPIETSVRYVDFKPFWMFTETVRTTTKFYTGAALVWSLFDTRALIVWLCVVPTLLLGAYLGVRKNRNTIPQSS